MARKNVFYNTSWIRFLSKFIESIFSQNLLKMKSKGAHSSSKKKGKICPRVFSSKSTPHLNTLRRDASLHDTNFRRHLSA